MISFLGIKKDTQISIRERLIIESKDKENIIKSFLEIFKEVVVLNTCNRTEIYFNHSNEEVEILKKIFEILKWDESLMPYIFIIDGEDVYKHLFEVACGYHSKIIGEDQILGQIKNTYVVSQKLKASNGELGRLFQEAITCGKRFRKEAKLYEIPVSSVSIAVNNLIEKKCKNVMVIGYGEVGKLAIKYLLSHKVKNICLALRNTSKAEELLDTEVNIININDKNEYINSMDAIISCTASPNTMINKNDINICGKEMLIFDMAVPRDVHKEVALIDGVKVLNIDEISKMEDENRHLRVERMNMNRHYINEYLYEYNEWIKLRSLSKIISEIKIKEKDLYNKRVVTFKNKGKNKDDVQLVEKLLKSTSNAYVNRAIEVLKEESLQGGEECLKIIKKIFLTEI